MLVILIDEFQLNWQVCLIQVFKLKRLLKLPSVTVLLHQKLGLVRGVGGCHEKLGLRTV
jgi:hypothetical protein